MRNSQYFSDISSNDSYFNAGEYASAGYGAIAIKATESDDYTNPSYAEWTRDAHSHGLPVFHYMFARPEKGDPRAQVERFWHEVQPHFRRPGDYSVFDVETGTPREGADWLREADPYMHNISGTHPVCYCPYSYYNEGALTVASGRFWIASWGNERPGRNWRLNGKAELWAWQYNGGVGLGGATGPLTYSGIPGTPDGSIMSLGLARELARYRKHRRRA